MIEIRRVPGPEAHGRAAAGLFVQQARRAIAARGQCRVALCGGPTFRRVLEELASSRQGQVDWDRIQVFWTDERAMSPGQVDSNYRVAHQALLSKVSVPRGQVHRIEVERFAPEAAARQYEGQIADACDVALGGPPPKFDLMFLSAETGVHSGARFWPFPPTAPTDRWVVERAVADSDARCVALAPALLHRAACVACLAPDSESANRLAASCESTEGRQSGSGNGRWIWYVDQSAATRLPGALNRRARVAPSILSADFAKLGAEIAQVEQAGVERIHVDVMDGHFVPNLSIGPPVVRSLRSVTPSPLETHLMITHPDQYVESFAAAGSDSIIFHREVACDARELATRIRELGMGVGVAVSPDTPAEALDDLVPQIDLALIMTVHPGFGGQSFMEDMLPKIAHVRALIDQLNPTCELEVDGGIDASTVPKVTQAGAQILVAGSAVFAADEGVQRAISRLRRAVPADR